VGTSFKYVFDSTVCNMIAESASRPRLGTLLGTVRTAGSPLADVALTVGRFCVISDKEGGFEIEAPPRTNRVGIARASAPTGCRAEEPTQVSVEVLLRET